MILAQARANVLGLEPRIRVTRECIECLEVGFIKAEALLDPGTITDPLISAIAQVQLIQLKAALVELEDSLAKSKEAIQQIESPIHLFRPAGFQG